MYFIMRKEPDTISVSEQNFENLKDAQQFALTWAKKLSIAYNSQNVRAWIKQSPLKIELKTKDARGFQGYEQFLIMKLDD